MLSWGALVQPLWRQGKKKKRVLGAGVDGIEDESDWYPGAGERTPACLS